MQVSKVASPNTNGKMQLSQPVGTGGYVGGLVVAVQMARNPVRGTAPRFDLNVTVSLLPLLMMVHGSNVCPQCLEMKLSYFNSTHAVLHDF